MTPKLNMKSKDISKSFFEVDNLDKKDDDNNYYSIFDNNKKLKTPKGNYTISKNERLLSLISDELNTKKVGSIQHVLIEKESKKSSNHWAGRTDSNEWVIFEKKSSNIKDIVPVEIVNATGVILHGKEMVGA